MNLHHCLKCMDYTVHMYHLFIDTERVIQEII